MNYISYWNFGLKLTAVDFHFTFLLIVIGIPMLLGENISPVNENIGAEDDVFVPFASLHTLDLLAYWAAKEEEIYPVLDAKLTMINREIDLISKYIIDYEKSSGEALRNSKVPLETPEERGKLIGSSAILSHIMTHRYATIVNDLRNLLRSEEYQNIEASVNQILEIGIFANEELQWPSSEDLYMSHFALIHLQEVYNYKPRELYKGLKIGTTFGGQLKAYHCTHLGIFALSEAYYYMAIEWLEFALWLLENDKTDESISPHFVKSLLDLAVSEHNYKFQNHSNVDINLFTHATYPGQPENERFTERQRMINEVGEKVGNSTGYSNQANMLLLCSGKEFQPKSIRSRMKCFYKREGHPYLILNPLKVEQLSEHPYVIQVYEILGNDLINEFLRSKGRLGVSTTANTEYSIKDSIRVRSSAGGSTDPKFEVTMFHKNDLIFRIPRGTDHGLEQIQNVEYLYGRHYGPHEDPLFIEEEPDKLDEYSINFGDRIATILYYLEVPVLGGATPFCNLGISAQPVRGSALFWLNVFKNGTIRGDITHAACPVIWGKKIILNQWIRYKPYFQLFPCSLNQFE